jgi:hypothetical protein
MYSDYNFLVRCWYLFSKRIVGRKEKLIFLQLPKSFLKESIIGLLDQQFW